MKFNAPDTPDVSFDHGHRRKPAPRLTQRWKKADYEQRRELIIDCALLLLDKHGLKAVTVRRVAQRLNIGAMTLYTYFNDQRDLHCQMVRRGFAMLHESCSRTPAETVVTTVEWRQGASNYLQFAISHPNLYMLMFNTPMNDEDEDILRGGYQHLLDKVRQQFAQEYHLSGDKLEHQARAAAGRFWIALHGLAMLAIAGRMTVLEGSLDHILDDLIPRVVPMG